MVPQLARHLQRLTAMPLAACSKALMANRTMRSSRALVDIKQLALRPPHLVLSPRRFSIANAACSAPTSWPRLLRMMGGGFTGVFQSQLKAAPIKTDCGACIALAVAVYMHIRVCKCPYTSHVWRLKLLVCRCPKPKEEGQCRFFQWADELGQQPQSTGQ